MRNRQRRRGLTLIELLVVFAVLAVLGSLVAAGIMNWIGGQSRRNTEAGIKAIYAAFVQHWEAVVTEAKKETIDFSATGIGPTYSTTSFLSYAGDSRERARVIWIKLRLKEAFPQNFQEITDQYTGVMSYIPQKRRRYLAGYNADLGKRNTGIAIGKSQGAACVYMSLSVNREGVSHGPEALVGHVKDSDGDNLMEFVDGWGEPYRFWRFPTDNTILQAAKPSILTGKKLDPLDPNGTLLDPAGTWTYSGDFDAKLHKRLNGTDAWFAVPVIASAGVDFKLGLSGSNSTEGTSTPYCEMKTTSSIEEKDNLYSYSVK